MTRRKKIFTLGLMMVLALILLTIACGSGEEAKAPVSSPSSNQPSQPMPEIEYSGEEVEAPVSSLSANQPPQPTPEIEYWAVLVGVSDYKYLEDTTLNDNDATALYQQLCSFWGEDHVKLLVNAEATQAGIEAALVDWLAPRESKEDVVLFFFAGHSSSGKYMLPHDSLETSYARDITGPQLDSWLDKLDSGNLVVILETCKSGAFITDLSEPGRVIMTSSDKNENSVGYSMLGRFVFPYYVIEAFSELEAVDSDRDYVVSAEEVFDYVGPKVTSYGERYGHPQHPQLYDGYEGELGLIQM